MVRAGTGAGRRMTLLVSRILHAGYVLEHSGTRLAIDPIFENPFSVNCHAYPDVRFDPSQIRALRFAAVFISHHHDDHCSLASLDLLDRSTPIYVYCVFEELLELIRALGFTRVAALELEVPVELGPFQVTPHRALDARVDSILELQVKGAPSLGEDEPEGAAVKVLDVGDAWLDPAALEELAARAPWDLVMWPFQTMRELEVIAPSRPEGLGAGVGLPPEWLEQLARLEPRYVVPSSCQFQMEPWSWYNRAFFPISYREFREQVEAVLPGGEVLRLDPSCSVALDARSLSPAPPLPWVELTGPSDVDYEYLPGARPPPTSEVARHFPALEPEQLRQVLDYCASGLLERYRSLEPPDGPYFQRSRTWTLALFDESGTARRYFYRVCGAAIERTSAPEPPLGWSTELPIAKLYGALARGETMTSMYVRINDAAFDPELEAELQDADPLEDPLLRCLFEGVFAGYQRAQLARLSSRAAPLVAQPAAIVRGASRAGE